jgi:lysophospholipase L1-like esterase
MSRLFAAGCLLALCLVAPAFAQDEKKEKKDKEDREKMKRFVEGLAEFFRALDDPRRKGEKPNPAAQKTNLEMRARHKLLLKRNADNKNKGDVIFLGDSITEGWESDGKEAWKEHFGAFEPVNLGVNGDWTGGLLWRISDGKEIEDLKPKAAVVLIGSNNVRDHSALQIAGAIRAIVEELKKQKPGMKILLLGVFPRGSGKDADRETKAIPAAKLNRTIGEINAFIAKLHDGKTVFYKDVGKTFLDKDGNLPREIMPDGLHLSARGYDVWGKAIKGDLEKLLK